MPSVCSIFLSQKGFLISPVSRDFVVSPVSRHFGSEGHFVLSKSSFVIQQNPLNTTASDIFHQRSFGAPNTESKKRQNPLNTESVQGILLFSCFWHFPYWKDFVVFLFPDTLFLLFLDTWTNVGSGPLRAEPRRWKREVYLWNLHPPDDPPWPSLACASNDWEWERNSCSIFIKLFGKHHVLWDK